MTAAQASACWAALADAVARAHKSGIRVHSWADDFAAVHLRFAAYDDVRRVTHSYSVGITAVGLSDAHDPPALLAWHLKVAIREVERARWHA